MSRSEETCWTMINQAAAGELSARSVFAETYLHIIRAYLRARWRLGGPLDRVDDAVQDVFLDCLRPDGALGRVDSERHVHFRTFLFGVVRNVALRYEERRAKDHARSGDDGVDPKVLAADDPALSLVFDREWARCLLARAITRHEELARHLGGSALLRFELLRLRFEDALPLRDIARRWNVEAAKVHRDYARAREEFKQALREEVRFHQHGTARSVEDECEALLALLQT